MRVNGVTAIISTNATASPGTMGWMDAAHGTLARVSAVHATVVRNPPTDEAVAAAGVVRGEDRPNSKGKKNVAPIMAIE
jgi:hypothetical protein